MIRNAILQELDRLGWSVLELSKQCEVRYNSINDYLNHNKELSSKNLEKIFKVLNLKITKMQIVEKTTTTVRYLKIDWKNKRMQANAKNNGFVWNGTKKLWEHKSRKAIEVPNHYEIIAYVYNPADNSEVGNFGTGCETTRYKADKYGYDAIEN